MIDKNTSNDSKEAFAATKESFMESLEWTKEDLAIANDKIVELEAENSRIPELEAENSRIPELEAEVARLTAKLNGK